jgi:hypothetical protein
MAETPSHLLEVTVVAREDSWEWQVQSHGTVLVGGTGRTRLLARFLVTTPGSACSPRNFTADEKSRDQTIGAQLPRVHGAGFTMKITQPVPGSRSIKSAENAKAKDVLPPTEAVLLGNFVNGV